ncbi:MAG: hypothetical protein ABEJ31_03815 [Haloarculaceae archaeon]
MPMKAEGRATGVREIDRRPDGVGWIAHPAERMQRASHAFAIDGDVWVCDPVDVPDLDDLLAEYGEVAGVCTLLDRHKRDAAAIANRHDVAVHVPDWMDGVAPALDAPVERLGESFADGAVTVHRLVNNRFWQEAALWIEPRDVLLVPESVGTASYFRAPGERLGVHPVLRLWPPLSLRQFVPERVLVGHGAGVADGAARALSDALSGSRRRAPRLYLRTAKEMAFG